ncbi:MAG TPA: AAA family ATPase [Polyangiaceae bacterium]
MSPNVPRAAPGCRIAMTGGPGGGKTTAADLFRRELGDRVVIVPESATILFSGGFPRSEHATARKSVQSAIFHVQRNIEDVQAALYPERILLCDRGTIDGAAYWPDGPADFFRAMDTSLEQELDRYDAVVFFETAAVAGLSIEGGNPVRRETLEQARQLDSAQCALWSQHPRFSFVPHDQSFFRKIGVGLSLLQAISEELLD